LSMRLCRGRISRLRLEPREACKRVGRVAVERHGALIGGPRSFDVIELFKQRAAIGMRRSQLWVDANGGIVSLKRRIGATKGLETDSEAVEDVRVVGRQGTGSLQQLDRFLEPPLAVARRSGEVEKGGVLHARRQR